VIDRYIRSEREWSVLPLIAASLRSDISLPKLAAIVVVAIVPCVLGAIESRNSAFRDDLDVLSNIMVSPLVLIFPLLVCLAVNGRLFGEIGHRYIFATRTRTAIEHYLTAKLVSAALAGAVIGLILAVVPILTAFIIWPLLGNPSVLPGVYGLSVDQASLDAVKRISLSEFLMFGSGTYASIYVLWVSLAGAIYGAMGVLALSLTSLRIVGLLAPFLLYLAQSVFFAVAFDAHFALMFSTFPFGLNQNTVATMVPNFTLMTLVTIASVLVVRRAGRLSRLS